MTDSIDTFVLSLDRDEPPSFATPMLRAIWHALRGDWASGHELAQAQDDPDGAWVHAWLHRVEGDLDNAEYWYRRAGRQALSGDVRTEGLHIARALIHSSGDGDTLHR